MTELEKKADEIKEARKEPETAAASKEVGDKPKETSGIEQFHTDVERMEKANIKKEELLNQEEKLVSARMLSGRAEAGQTAVEKTQDEKDQETADAMVKNFQ